jgi:hypothetical protein
LALERTDLKHKEVSLKEKERKRNFEPGIMTGLCLELATWKLEKSQRLHFNQ